MAIHVQQDVVWFDVPKRIETRLKHLCFFNFFKQKIRKTSGSCFAEDESGEGGLLLLAMFFLDRQMLTLQDPF